MWCYDLECCDLPNVFPDSKHMSGSYAMPIMETLVMNHRMKRRRDEERRRPTFLNLTNGVALFVCLSVCMSIRPSVCMSFGIWGVCIYVFVSVSVSVCVCECACVRMHVCVCVCVCVCAHACLG